MKLVTVEYQERQGKPHVLLFCREGKSRKIIDVSNYKPYFYVPGPNGEYTTLDGSKARKIETNLPQEVGSMRGAFPTTYEADVHFTTRYLIDNVPDFEKVNLRVQYTDIEKDLETNQITAISAFDSYLNRCFCFAWREDLKPEKKQLQYVFEKTGYKFDATVYIFNNKLDMMRTYVKFVRDTDPDILTGWFFVQYDAKELIKDLDSAGIGAKCLSPIGSAYMIGEQVHRRLENNIAIKGRVLWDMLKAYASLQPTKLLDSSLEAISQEELGEGKEKLEKGIGWNWHNDFDKFVEYNCKDSVLVHRIDKKRGVLEHFDYLRRFIGGEWDQLFSETLLWDTYILRKEHNKIVLPTKRRIPHEKFKGALVFMPIRKGIHKWIIVVDFKSLYPSIIRTFNMSPETVNPTGEKVYSIGNGVTFSFERPGLFPQILTEMTAERKKYNDEKKKYPFESEEWKTYDHLSTAIKVMMNALYGATAYSNFRLVTEDLAKSVTFIDRKIIDACREEIAQTHRVLYGDTDSLFIISHFADLKKIVPEAQALVDRINKFCTKMLKDEYGIDKSYITIDLKKINETFIMADLKTRPGTAAKKRYGERIRWGEGDLTDKLNVMGFESKRSDSSIFSRKLQKEVIRMILYGEEVKVKTYIRDCIKSIRELPPEEIAIPKGLSMELDDYGADNPHRRAALYSNKVFGTDIGMGDKPKVLYVSSTGKYPHTDVVPYSRELPSDFVIDYDIMIQKDITEKIEHILDAAGMDMQDIFLDKKTIGEW